MIFEPITINGLEIKNRFVRSATNAGFADEDGNVTDKQVAYFKSLSEGGIGLIITGHMFIDPGGLASPGMTAIYADEHIDGLKKIADAIHSHGAKGIVQINHGGMNAKMLFDKEEIVAPSALRDGEGPTPRALTLEEIEKLIQAYAAAACRTKEAGFDGVQLHGAHGYLISQFLSPLTNQRDDAYGGSFENRCLFLKRVVEASRQAVGDDFPLMIKLGCRDREGGMAVEEGVQVGQMLEELGIDAIEVSGGVGADSTPMRIKKPEDEAIFTKEVSLFRKQLSIPLIQVSAFRSLSVMEAALTDGPADMVSLCRPFIREQDLVNKLQSGASDKALCISCNRCFKEIGPDFGCAIDKRESKGGSRTAPTKE